MQWDGSMSRDGRSMYPRTGSLASALGRSSSARLLSVGRFPSCQFPAGLKPARSRFRRSRNRTGPYVLSGFSAQYRPSVKHPLRPAVLHLFPLSLYDRRLLICRVSLCLPDGSSRRDPYFEGSARAGWEQKCSHHVILRIERQRDLMQNGRHRHRDLDLGEPAAQASVRP